MPTVDQVHVPTAIGNKTKGKKPTMAKKLDNSGDDQEMGKKAKLGKVPPQFLPKGQKADAKAGVKPAAKGGKPFAKKK